jgi:hypothetical protein
MFRSSLFAITAVVLLSAVHAFSSDGGKVWRHIEVSRAQVDSAVNAPRPNAFEAFSLDRAALERALTKAAEEFSGGPETIITVPLPDGTLGRFRVEHSLVVEPGLVSKYPELGATYRGYGIDDPTASIRFDLMAKGFHAMILRAGTTLFVDPLGRDDIYLAYEKTALPPRTEPFVCHTNESDIADVLMSKESRDAYRPDAAEVSNGATMRTYRLALAATGEYTAFTGGTKATALAAQVVSMNRVNAVYERDLAIHMNIVANNDLIVYTDAATDPYTNNSGSTMLGQNQTNLNNVIGTANYDIGHVFSTGGGGVANLGVPCGTSKARGVTGSSNPVGDGFDIDYVAHEMGHQFGGQHTFNGTTGSCGGGNRSGPSALEPGSGITVMAYAGICGAEDLAMHSIDTFAVKSLEQIVAFKEAGGSCGVPTATGNTPPTVTSQGTFTVPFGTPFSLTATGSDVNGDTLSYDWQEYDFGAAAPPNSDADGQARPLFRSYNPTVGRTRTFPSLTYILGNANTPPASYNCGRAALCLTGEVLPTISRTMVFQVVARDNRAGGGGIATSTSQVAVSSLSGPFQVTAPNTAVNVGGGTSLNVTWAVNNTTAPPVNAANVDILLSTDGGVTFPTVLASGTPNDGSQSVTIPNVSTSMARVKVQGTGNIFFDISNADFTITAAMATVSGRVLFGERGVRNARVTLTGPGFTQTAVTGPRGNFVFTNVPTGQTYTASVLARRFLFSPQTFAVTDNLSGLVFQSQ